MSLQPDTDRKLARTSGRLAVSGAKLLALAVALDVVGVILLLAVTTVGALFCFGLSLPLWLAATGLIGSGAVGRRASEQKPFA